MKARQLVTLFALAGTLLTLGIPAAAEESGSGVVSGSSSTTLGGFVDSALAAELGNTVLSQPGDWSIAISAGGDRILYFGRNANYLLENLSFGVEQVPDPSGEWDWLQSYPGNGSFQCSYLADGQTNLFSAPLTRLLLKVRSTRYQATNSSYLEFAASAQAGPFIYQASYAGTASVTNLPETADSLPGTLYSGTLQDARLVLAPPLQIAQSGPQQVTLSWSTNALGLVLEASEALERAPWTAVTNPPSLGSNNSFQVTLEAARLGEYFRLRLAF